MSGHADVRKEPGKNVQGGVLQAMIAAHARYQYSIYEVTE
jgi:hypothetical protein